MAEDATALSKVLSESATPASGKSRWSPAPVVGCGVGWGAEVRSDLEAHHSTGNGISNLGIKGWQKSLAGPLTTVLLSTLSSYRPALKQPHPAPRPAPITYAK